MTTYNPDLVWPRSDGNQSSWPSAEEQVPSPTSSWWEKLPTSHEKYKLYETKVGAKLAELQGVKAPSYRIRLPDNYALFAHHKPNADGERIDVYLRGCPLIGKKTFRSPNEFLPHAEWLVDTSRPLNDHTTCACQYNNASDAARAKKQGSSSLGSGATPNKTPKEKNEKKRKERTPSPPEEQPAAIVPERMTDIQSGRRFRKGELVWFKIDTIYPPEALSATHPAITHWPGLVANAQRKRTVVQPPKTNDLSPATLSTLSALSNAPAPETPAKPVVITTWDYHIRPMGFFSPSAEVPRRPEGLLPYATGLDLLGGSAGWALIGKEGTRVIRERVAAEVADLKGKGLPLPSEEAEIDKRWRESMAKRWAFLDMPKDWDTVVFRLGLAIKVASTVSNSWTQTDKIDFVPGQDVNPEDRQAIQSQLKTLYQGLWWGGERIWCDDMVRLKKHRIELPVDALGVPSEGASDRAVLLKIRMITVEVSPESTKDNHAWQVLLYGDIFEVVKSSGAKSEKETGKAAWGDAINRPPKGYAYKQLNETGAEVTVDVMDVAGRAYPDLLDPATQHSFYSETLTEEENKDRPKAGDSAIGLTTLKPGTVIASKSDKWKEDLYTIVSEANKLTERDMKRFYVGPLNPEAAKVNGANGAPKSANAGPEPLPSDAPSAAAPGAAALAASTSGDVVMA